MEEITLVLDEAKELMDKCHSAYKSNLQEIRAGKASPAQCWKD